MERESTSYEEDSNIGLRDSFQLNQTGDPVGFYHPVEDLGLGAETPFKVNIPEAGSDYEVKGRFDAGKLMALRAYQQHFGLEPDVVYYPGSRNDLSPSAAFQDSEIFYNDIEDIWMTELEDLGLNVVGGDAEEIVLNKELGRSADLIFLNMYTGSNPSQIIEKSLDSGGYLITDSLNEDIVEIVDPIASASLSDDGWIEIYEDEPGRFVLAEKS